jgi:hypothetical protein
MGKKRWTLDMPGARREENKMSNRLPIFERGVSKTVISSSGTHAVVDFHEADFVELERRVMALYEAGETLLREIEISRHPLAHHETRAAARLFKTALAEVEKHAGETKRRNALFLPRAPTEGGRSLTGSLTTKPLENKT